jgi:hypothetical protein
LMKKTVLDVHPREPILYWNPFKRQYIVRNKKTGFANADWYSTDWQSKMKW